MSERHEQRPPAASDPASPTGPGDREQRYERVMKRERAEPEELRNPVPRWLAVLSLGLIAWGTWYYFDNAGFPAGAGDRRTALVRAPADQVDGAAVYAAQCVSCHQASGKGLAGVFPPLAGSRWVTGEPARVVQILLHGINGAIEVQGQQYNGVMPAFGHLADGEIAAVLSYVRSSWSNDATSITPAQVAQGRQRYPDREAAWQGGAELNEAFPPPVSPPVSR